LTPTRPKAAGSSVAALLPSGRAFAVLVELGVVAAGAPALQHLADRGLVELQRLLERLQGRRQGHDRADVEVAVRPAVQTLTDALHEGVVDCRMAQRAVDPDADHAGLDVDVRPMLDAVRKLPTPLGFVEA
jgi:hypothetical protein